MNVNIDIQDFAQNNFAKSVGLRMMGEKKSFSISWIKISIHRMMSNHDQTTAQCH